MGQEIIYVGYGTGSSFSKDINVVDIVNNFNLQYTMTSTFDTTTYSYGTYGVISLKQTKSINLQDFSILVCDGIQPFIFEFATINSLDTSPIGVYYTGNIVPQNVSSGVNYIYFTSFTFNGFTYSSQVNALDPVSGNIIATGSFNISSIALNGATATTVVTNSPINNIEVLTLESGSENNSPYIVIDNGKDILAFLDQTLQPSLFVTQNPNNPGYYNSTLGTTSYLEFASIGDLSTNFANNKIFIADNTTKTVTYIQTVPVIDIYEPITRTTFDTSFFGTASISTKFSPFQNSQPYIYMVANTISGLTSAVYKIDVNTLNITTISTPNESASIGHNFPIYQFTNGTTAASGRYYFNDNTINNKLYYLDKTSTTFSNYVGITTSNIDILNISHYVTDPFQFLTSAQCADPYADNYNPSSIIDICEYTFGNFLQLTAPPTVINNNTTTYLTITASRSFIYSNTASFFWTVGTGLSLSATPSDFVGGVYPSGNVIFPDGILTTSFNIPIQATSLVEPNENFTVTLSSFVNLKGIRNYNYTIVNDNLPNVTLDVSGIINYEGNTGSTPFTFSSFLYPPSSVTASYDWFITTYAINGATNGATPSDFVGGTFPTGSVIFNPGQTAVNTTFYVQGNTVPGPNENFLLTLTNLYNLQTSGPTAFLGTILDDDTLPNLTIIPLTQFEGNPGTTNSLTNPNYWYFTAKRSGSNLGTASFGWNIGPYSEYVYIISKGPSVSTYTQNTIIYQDVSENPLPISNSGDPTNLNDSNLIRLTTQYALGTMSNVWTDRLNTIGVWTQNIDGSPFNSYIGFTASINIPATGSYCIGFAADNTGRLFINNNLIIELLDENSISDNNFPFITWHVIPLTLNAGPTLIELSVENYGDAGSFGAEIYNATPATLASYTTDAQLSAVTIFSTINYVGGEFILNTSPMSVDKFDFVGDIFPSGTASFAPLQTTLQIPFLVNPDTQFELNENYVINITSLNGLTTSNIAYVGQVLNDDTSACTLNLDVTNCTNFEGSDGSVTQFSFIASRSLGDITLGASFSWRITPSSVNSTVDRFDFQNDQYPSGVVNFTDGEANQVVTFYVNADTNYEPNEEFFISIYNLSNLLAPQRTYSGFILNDDTEPTVNGQNVSNTGFVNNSLIFYDQNGYNINFTYNPTLTYYEGTIIMDRNSSDTFKTSTIYTFEKLPETNLSSDRIFLNRFQLFNEYGINFIEGKTHNLLISSFEVSNNDSSFYSKWINGPNFEALYPIGSEVQFSMSFNDINSYDIFTVVNTRKGGIMILTPIDNLTYINTYGSSYDTMFHNVTLDSRNCIKVLNYLNIVSATQSLPNLSSWNERYFYRKMFVGRKLSIANSTLNSSVTNTLSTRLSAQNHLYTIDGITGASGSFTPAVPDKTYYSYGLTGITFGEDLILELQLRTDKPVIVNDVITFTNLITYGTIAFTSPVSNLLKPLTKFQVINSNFNNYAYTVAEVDFFDQLEDYNYNDLVLYNNLIYNCIFTYSFSNTINPDNNLYWNLSNFVYVTTPPINEISAAQIQLFNDTLTFTQSWSGSADLTMAAAAENYSPDFNIFNINLTFDPNTKLNAQLIYPGQWAFVNYYSSIIDPFANLASTQSQYEKIILIEEQVTQELNRNISVLPNVPIVITSLDNQGFTITINGSKYFQETIFQYFSPGVIDMDSTIDASVRAWLALYSTQLNNLFITISLSRTSTIAGTALNTISLIGQYPNVDLTWSVVTGTNVNYYINYGYIEFGDIGAALIVKFYNAQYDISANDNPLYNTLTTNQKIVLWVNKWANIIADTQIIVQAFGNKILVYLLNIKDRYLTISVQIGKLLFPSEITYQVITYFKDNQGLIITSNEIMIDNANLLLVDQTTNHYDGIVNGNPVPSLLPSPFTGHDNAYLFDGVDRGDSDTMSVTLQNLNNIPKDTIPFTIEANINWSDNAVGIRRTILSKWSGYVNSSNYILEISELGQLKFWWIDNNTIIHNIIGGSVSFGGNNTVALDYTGLTISLYLNGINQVATASVFANPFINNTPNYIGRIQNDSFSHTNPFYGYIDDMRFSSISRFNGAVTYSLSSLPLAVDQYTIALYNFDTLDYSSLRGIGTNASLLQYFSLGQVVSVNNTQYTNQNTTFNANYVAGNRVQLSYEGPFTGTKDYFDNEVTALDNIDDGINNQTAGPFTLASFEPGFSNEPPTVINTVSITQSSSPAASTFNAMLGSFQNQLTDLYLSSKATIRRPKANTEGDSIVTFRWRWQDDSTPELFLVDTSGNQLTPNGNLTYLGVKPLINPQLISVPNADIKSIFNASKQQTVFPAINYPLDYLSTTQYDDISGLPSPLEAFIGFQSLTEGVSSATLILEKSENIVLVSAPSLISNNYFIFSHVIEEITGNQYDSIVLDTDSDILFTDKFATGYFKIGQTIQLTLVDVSNKTSQYISVNNGKQFIIKQIFNRELILDGTLFSNILEADSTLITNYPSVGIITYIQTTITVMPTTLAVINVLGETEIEDVRYKTFLGNIGKLIKPNDVYIFREYDLNEQGLDWTYLNKKRKELIEIRRDIYDFIGSYKAIINSINYFGYNDLEFNEYYRNINQNSPYFNQLVEVQIPDIFNTVSAGWTEIDPIKKYLPSDQYEETNLFNLSFDITDFQGNNILNTPLYDFFKKVMGLRTWLETNVIPLTHKIYDVTGNVDIVTQISIQHENFDIVKIPQTQNINPVTITVNEADVHAVSGGSTTYNVVVNFTVAQDPAPDYFTLKIRTYQTYNVWDVFTTYYLNDIVRYFGRHYKSVKSFLNPDGSINTANKYNNPLKYNGTNAWNANTIYAFSNIVIYNRRYYEYINQVTDSTNTNTPFNNSDWFDITDWLEIDLQPVQNITEFRRDNLLPFNFTVDTNIDPYTVIEVNCENGYGINYRQTLNVEVRYDADSVQAILFNNP